MNNEDDNVRETIESIAETTAHDGSTIQPSFFEYKDITETTARSHLEALVDAGKLERYEAEDGSIEYGLSSDNLSPAQISGRLNHLIQFEISEPHPVSWYTNKIGVDPDIVEQKLLRLYDKDKCEVFEQYPGTEPLFGRTGMDPASDTYQLQGSGYNEELVFPDGTSGRASTTSEGNCTVAERKDRDTIVVFVDDEASFTINEYVATVNRLSRSIAVSPAGYIAYHSGGHREKVFNLQTCNGESVIQRISGSARTPSFTPDGDYVAYWRMVDHTIYCYDVEAAADSGRFDTDQLPGMNIDVEGVEYEGEPAFAFYDTYGPGEDELVGYISPSGDLLHSEN